MYTLYCTISRCRHGGEWHYICMSQKFLCQSWIFTWIWQRILHGCDCFLLLWSYHFWIKEHAHTNVIHSWRSTFGTHALQLDAVVNAMDNTSDIGMALLQVPVDLRIHAVHSLQLLQVRNQTVIYRSKGYNEVVAFGGDCFFLFFCLLIFSYWSSCTQWLTMDSIRISSLDGTNFSFSLVPHIRSRRRRVLLTFHIAESLTCMSSTTAFFCSPCAP